MFLQNKELILYRSLPVQQWLWEWWGHTEQMWNWWWRWWWWYVKTPWLPKRFNLLLSWAACCFLIDTNLHYRSCLITCKMFHKTENFSQISLWLNLPYLRWHCLPPWPWKWWFSCQNNISTLFRSWDIDENLFYGDHFVKSKMAAIQVSQQMETLFFWLLIL